MDYPAPAGTTLSYPAPVAPAFLKANPLTFDDELCKVGDTSPSWGLGHAAIQILLSSAYRSQRESGQEAPVADVPHPRGRQQHPTLPLRGKRDGRIRQHSNGGIAWMSPYYPGAFEDPRTSLHAGVKGIQAGRAQPGGRQDTVYRCWGMKEGRRTPNRSQA